ncbi:MAG: rhomboid family intramembrane serine protease, partial [Allobranchiibius sp.]
MSTPPQQTQPVCPRHTDRVAYVTCQVCGRPTCPDCQRPAAVGIHCVDCVRENGKTVRQ